MTDSAMDRLRPVPEGGFEPDAWRLLRALADRTRWSPRWEQPVGFRPDAEGALGEVATPAEGWAFWDPARGWSVAATLPSPARELLELYLPLCTPDPDRSFVIGHLGQSLDGCIATSSGDSDGVTGRGNILHLHRLRALCDAILVGAGTVAADDPRLTTRLVEGTSPLRVVLDPRRRLESRHGLFNDGAADTLIICGSGHGGGNRAGRAEVVEVPQHPDGGLQLGIVLAVLRDRGCRRVMVEGGGITVSAFVSAGLLDRLHVAVSPVIIGGGRPGLGIATSLSMQQARRPRHRIYRMGTDVLFDCDLSRAADPGDSPSADALDLIWETPG